MKIKNTNFVCILLILPMRYYLIAGEASGDLHASNLMSALKKEDPSAVFRYYGGEKMQSEGGELVRHY